MREYVATLMAQLQGMEFRMAILTGMMLSQPGLIGKDGTPQDIPLEPDLDIALTAVVRAWMEKDADNDDSG